MIMLRALPAFLLVVILYINGSAQFLPFGKNKILYNPAGWKKIESAHFSVYYYDSLYSVAMGAVPVIEDAYRQYTSDFGQTVNYKIPLIIYNTHNHFAQTNVLPGILPEGIGGFFEYIKGRVVIPFNGSQERFHHVLRHELVHVFTNSRLNNILRERRISLDRYPPLWYTEGLAEYLSSGVDAQGEMVMRDAVISGYFPALEDFDRIRGSYLMYKGGQVFLEFFTGVYGREAAVKLLDNMWLSPDFKVVIEQTAGEAIQKISEKWKSYLRERFNAHFSFRETSPDSITDYTPPGYHFSPTVVKTTNGTKIYFLSNADGYTSLFSAVSGTHPFRIPGVPAMELRGEKEANFEVLHLMQRSLAAYRDSILCFIAKTGGNDRIYLMELHSGKVSAVLDSAEFISISDPSFSQTQPLLLFRGIGKTGYADIYLLNLRTKELKQLTDDAYDDKEPSFAYNGSVVFASSGRDGDPARISNIYTYDVNGYSITRLTDYNYALSSPLLSQEGQLYFTSDFSGVKQMYRYDISQKKVTHQYGSFLTGILDPVIFNDTLFYTAYNDGAFTIRSVAPGVMTAVSDTFARTQKIPEVVAATGIISSEEKVYKRDYAIDFAATQFTADPVYGNRGGGALTLSDLLGDDSYEFVFYNTAEVQSDFLKSLNVAVSRYLTTPGMNYSYGVFHFNGRRYDLRESDDYFFERSYGMYVAAIKPYSFFSRTELSASLINSDKELFGAFSRTKSTLLSLSVSQVFDNTLWYATGAIDGSRYRFLIGYTSDVKNSEVNYLTLIGDYRRYFRLGMFSSLAARVSVYYNEGKAARRYIMGGSWDLRGYPRFSLRGEKMWISSLELRTPLIDQFFVRFPALTIPFGMVRGAAFFDAGSTWDKTYSQTYGSVGIGFRINLFNSFALRYDMGKTIENNFSKFQKGLFYQFFFGWDF